jgi:hypothetical protein
MLCTPDTVGIIKYVTKKKLHHDLIVIYLNSCSYLVYFYTTVSSHLQYFIEGMHKRGVLVRMSNLTVRRINGKT